MMILSGIQQQIADILRTQPVFGSCEIISIDKGDIVNRIEEAMSAYGTAILIAPPSVRFFSNGGQGPVSTDGGVRTVIQIIEPPGVPRAAGVPSALNLAETAGWLLHSANYPERRDYVPLGLEDISAIPDPDTLTIQLTLVCTAALEQPENIQG